MTLLLGKPHIENGRDKGGRGKEGIFKTVEMHTAENIENVD